MSIASEQNKADNLRLLAAQRCIYSQAKALHLWRLVTAILLAAAAPALLFFWPGSKVVLAVIGGVLTLIAHLVLEGSERQKIKQAANIQEQFDLALFKLPWNKYLAGDKLTPELICAAERDFKEDREKLKDWYPDTGSVPHPLDVLLCQRANLVWDWRLRRHYAFGVSAFVIVVLIADLIIAITTKQTVLDYLLALFLPSLPAVTQGIDLAREHLRIADEKEHTEKEASALLESALNDPTSITKEDCRRIQDSIYSMRSKGPLVPDWWYRWLRDRYDVDMDEAAATLRTRAEEFLAEH